VTGPRRVLFVTHSMGGGGAERGIATLLRFLDRSRFAPSLALLSCTGPYLTSLPSDVTVHDLGERSRYDWRLPIKRLQRLIDADAPSVVVGVLRHPNLLSLAASWRSRRRPPVVVVEQSALSRGFTSSRLGWLKKSLHRWLYPRAAAVIVVSKGVGTDLQEQLGPSSLTIAVIPNPCDLESVREWAVQEPDVPVDWSRPTIVGVGRLEAVKGFDLLLEALAKVRSPGGCQLLILGEGPLAAQLIAQARRLGIDDRVQFLGFRLNPFAYMARARALVLSSLAEGAPNVLVEAMACGTPVVSTDCPFGPGEILQGGACGLLVPPSNAPALAEGIERVLSDGALAAKLSEAGLVRAGDFAAERVTRAYEAVFEKACAFENTGSVLPSRPNRG
jgi:glycosyltransferase involved in cell wall biosynthesis